MLKTVIIISGVARVTQQKYTECLSARLSVNALKYTRMNTFTTQEIIEEYHPENLPDMVVISTPETLEWDGANKCRKLLQDMWGLAINYIIVCENRPGFDNRAMYIAINNYYYYPYTKYTEDWILVA